MVRTRSSQSRTGHVLKKREKISKKAARFNASMEFLHKSAIQFQVRKNNLRQIPIKQYFPTRKNKQIPPSPDKIQVPTLIFRAPDHITPDIEGPPHTSNNSRQEENTVKNTKCIYIDVEESEADDSGDSSCEEEVIFEKEVFITITLE